MAVESDNVTADVIEVSEFPDIAQQYAVRGVPKTVIDGRIDFDGAVPEAMLIQRLVDAAAQAH
jgi:predicted DsbA family dithiol-disulfide isomerase